MVVENAWYALRVANDPAPPARAEIWLRRREGEAAESRCSTEFGVRSMRATHAAHAAATEAALDTLYRRTIALGAHPNEHGILAATTRTEIDEAYTFEMAFLTNRPLLMALALKSAVEAAVGATKTFRLIFPERFAIVGLDGNVEKLVGALNAAVRPYVPAKA